MLISIDIFLIILLVAVLQSIFGVGVLLVGTPILMLVGYSYFEVLSFTLPTSLVISISQVSRYYKDINFILLKKALVFAIPIIPIGMIIAAYLGSIIGIIMGLFLFLTSFSYFVKFILPVNASNTQLSIILFLMGLIQGSTSLGGGILPSIVNQKCSLKEQKLATTAAIYILFQLTQISFIIVKKYPINFSKSGICVIIGFVAYEVIGKKLFRSIKSEGYTVHLRTFIRVVAIMLVTIKLYNLNK
jgi:uncharacterized membrane protein YfcA